MRVILHMCCGPCAIMPIKRLIDEGYEVEGLFYNPNIHPLSEYEKRLEGALEVADRYNITMSLMSTLDAHNDFAQWMHMVNRHEHPGERCPLCWHVRLATTMSFAQLYDCAYFTTTLLYSRYQNHELIVDICKNLQKQQIPSATNTTSFMYRDFRTDWQEGINISKEWNIYRQKYCGCIFSDNESYLQRIKKHAYSGIKYAGKDEASAKLIRRDKKTNPKIS